MEKKIFGVKVMGVRIGRTQKVICSTILMVGMVLGIIKPTQEVMAKNYDTGIAVAVQEEVRAELETAILQLADVETGSLEKNTFFEFFEKAETEMGWVIDDAPKLETKWREETEPQEIEQVTDLERTDLIQEIEEVKSYGMVTCERLNFRKGPSVKHQIKKVLTKGSVCEILSRTKSGWYHVKESSTGSTGYVSGQYMKEVSERTALKEQEKQEKKIKAAQRAEKARREAEKKLEEEASKHSYKGVQMQYSKRYHVTKSPLTPIMGTKKYNGSKETWYSELKRPGGGLKIPGRHVAEDGTIRDKDGYICVAAHIGYKKYGTKLMTSRGPSKVYDTGCGYGKIDVYTRWKKGQKVK